MKTPPIPPGSNFFRSGYQKDDDYIQLPLGGQFSFRDTCKDIRFVIAAVAIEEWDQISIKTSIHEHDKQWEAIRAKSEWRKWRDEESARPETNPYR